MFPNDYPHREALIAGGVVTRAQVRAASDQKLIQLPNLGEVGVKGIRAYEAAHPEAPYTEKPKAARKSVEVLVDNLGPDLLKKGTVTDDPAIVALLDRRGQKLVREVK